MHSLAYMSAEDVLHDLTDQAADGCERPCLHFEAVQAARATLLPLDDAHSLADVFGVLADPTRVRMVQALSERELCVCDLANVLRLRQSTVSHQLRLLRALRIVRYRKEGRVAYYTLDDAHVSGLLAQCLDHVREQAEWAVQRMSTTVAG